ncbi:MAG TPA: radical SAM protein [Planctomycetota bacterium]|jgi:hypothetical protein
MSPRILLVNPPVYDFSAYDFWLKPYGMLSVAGLLRGQADFVLFDYLDRLSPLMHSDKKLRADHWGRGEFCSQPAPKPEVFADIPRHYHRFGVPREAFRHFLSQQPPFDFALIQTGMTYWYPGVREVIDDLRAFSAKTKIVLGGVYATLCPTHAGSLGADLVVSGTNLDPLWQFLGTTPPLTPSFSSQEPRAKSQEPPVPLWDLYPRLQTGVLKLADGCPFRCTYCSVPQVYAGFTPRPIERVLAEYDFLRARGVTDLAFYDDALGYQADNVLMPFLREVIKHGSRATAGLLSSAAAVNLHTPNALHARYMTPEVTRLMIDAGFKIIFLGFESQAVQWQRATGGKVYAHDLEQAVRNLLNAGAKLEHLHAYLIMGHPQHDQQDLEGSMRLASSLGLRIMLAEFSPIPGTPDGEACRKWIDLDEPLNHNKTSFPFVLLGETEVRRLKQLCRDLNAARS